MNVFRLFALLLVIRLVFAKMVGSGGKRFNVAAHHDSFCRVGNALGGTLPPHTPDLPNPSNRG
jgi:hypothetical protein